MSPYLIRDGQYFELSDKKVGENNDEWEATVTYIIDPHSILQFTSDSAHSFDSIKTESV
jgi:hypothetical protein